MAKYERCAADGCIKRPRPKSRYCEPHYGRIKRTGSPTGRIVRKQELRPWRDIAAGWVDRNRDHPAVVAACGYLGAMLAPVDGARFLGSEFERLRAAGVTGRDMLAAIVGWWAWAEASGARGIDDPCWDVNLGRAVLRCARQSVVSRAKSGRIDHKRVDASHAKALGEDLRVALGALPLLAAQKIVDEALGPERSAAAIRAALAVPFAEPEDDHG